MPEEKQEDKKISLHPLTFEEAVKGLIATGLPEEKEKKKKAPPKRRQRTDKKTEE